MAVAISRREIEKEADDNIALGRLLRIERDEEKKQAVERILATDLRIPQKIEKIKEIDEKHDAQEIERVVQQAYLQDLRREFVRLRSLVKAPQKSVPYLRYMFRERRRIRDFGRKTHVLETPLFPPGIRANRELRNYFVRDLQNWSAEISPRLELITEHGWLHLTPLQYNLIVLLKSLADKCLAFDFVHLDYRDRKLIERMNRIERLFLMLYYRSEYRDIVQESILTVYRKQGKEEAEGQETRSLAVRILAEDATLPSLYNCIVGLNMVKCRRFLTLGDLMEPGLREVVNTRDFNCTLEVKLRIDAYIHNSLESIKKLHSQLHEVRRLNSYLNYDEQGSLDTGNLNRLYEKSVPEQEGDFRTDQSNVLVFAQRLFEAFYRTFLSFLNGKVELGGIGRTAIFSRSFYEMEMARLVGIVERLKKGPFHFSNFPLSQYLQVKEAKIGAIGNEMELVQLIDEGIACLADLGKSLAKVIGGSTGKPRGQSEQPDQPEPPLEPVIFQGKPYFIPYGETPIRDRSYLKGMTVTQALADVTSLCFTMGMLFRDRFVYFVLGSAKRYETELQAQLGLMKNLLDPERYREVLFRYQ
jgi:hypothetical protein